MNTKLATLGAALIVVALAAAALSAGVHRDLSRTNDFVALFPVELLAVLLAGGFAWGYLQSNHPRAPGFTGVGMYLVLVAAAIGTAFPLWLPSDNTILGSALLAGVLAGAGASLVVASTAVLAGWSQSRSAATSLLAGVLAFLGVTAGGVVAPLLPLQVPLLVVVLVGISRLAVAWRQRDVLVRPVVTALIGAAATVGVLLLRGPDDWASGSTSVKLYSVPIVVMALGVSLLVLATSEESRASD